MALSPSARGVFETRLRLHQRGAHADQRERWEQDRIRGDQQRRALIERLQCNARTASETIASAMTSPGTPCAKNTVRSIAVAMRPG